MTSAIRSILLHTFVLGLFGASYARESASQPHPPIAIHFHLDHPGYVTLVIDNTSGVRVRNLVSDTYFPAGDQIAWWDGLDDLGRDTDSAAHAVYNIPGKLALPGTYTVRGLYRDKIDLAYEFSIYNPGQPPWKTNETSSEWLTTHTPPGAICFIPPKTVPVHGKHDVDSPAQVLIGSAVAEGGSGLAWVDLDGNKLHGQTWVGGDWTGAEQIARDRGAHPELGVYAYTVANFDNKEIRLQKFLQQKPTGLKPIHPLFGNGEDQPVLDPAWKYPNPALGGVGGLAAYNGLVIVSFPKMNQLLLVDSALSRVIGTFPVLSPRGLFADGTGHLFVVSDKKLLKMTIPDGVRRGNSLGQPEMVVADGLEDPQQVTADDQQNLYISDWGSSNQVKVFSPQGKILRSIGDAGVPASGPYNPHLMHHPKGLAIDNRNQLWVAEEDFQPKRVSLWSLNGQFVRALYGPVTYGGGGNLDPKDKTLFYLDGMTFRLNWDTGESNLIEIYHRPKAGDADLAPMTAPNTQKQPFEESALHTPFAPGQNPDLPIHFGGRLYFTNAYNSDAVTGTPVVGLWMSKNGVAVPVAAFGKPDSRQLFLTAAFKSHIPMLANRLPDPNKPLDLSGYTFVWSDLNGDGVAQPDEITLIPGAVQRVTLSPDLGFTTDTAISYKPVSFTASGAPLYDLKKGKMLYPAAQTQQPTTSGGGQVLAAQDDRTIFTTGPKPFASQSMAGSETGIAKWSYPSLWPGLHASHIAPLPELPGELIGTTRLLGPSLRLKNAKDIELWAVNGNEGNIYLFTTDGLFVTTLFKDVRLPSSTWAQRNKAIHGMSVTDLTARDENFWPSITQTDDGHVYVVTTFPAVIRVDGLDSIQRLSASTLEVTPDLLQQAKSYFVGQELSRQRENQASAIMTVPVETEALPVNADLSKWDPKLFVTIDERSKQLGDWSRIKIQAEAALRVAGDRLYAAFKTNDPNAVENSGASLQNLFKTGGALDLMLATDPAAHPERTSADAGDIRLLVSLVKGKPVAVLYRPVAPAARQNSVTFASPLSTLRFDDVEDVSDSLQFANADPKSAAAGDFEFSVPLKLLGLKPAPGTELRGDVGLLRGDGVTTVQRVYWSDKSTGLVSDIPSEAALTPQLWGRLKFVEGSTHRGY